MYSFMMDEGGIDYTPIEKSTGRRREKVSRVEVASKSSNGMNLDANGQTANEFNMD